MFNIQKAITPKVGKVELQFMCSARHFIVLYFCVKFHENISDGIRVMEQTQMMEALTDRHSKFRRVYYIIPLPLFVVGHKKGEFLPSMYHKDTFLKKVRRKSRLLVFLELGMTEQIEPGWV